MMGPKAAEEPAETLFGWFATAGTLAVLLPASGREEALETARGLFGRGRDDVRVRPATEVDVDRFRRSQAAPIRQRRQRRIPVHPDQETMG